MCPHPSQAKELWLHSLIFNLPSVSPLKSVSFQVNTQGVTESVCHHATEHETVQGEAINSDVSSCPCVVSGLHETLVARMGDLRL